MKTYIIYPAKTDLKNGYYHVSDDSFTNAHNFFDLSEFESLTHQDRLIYLLPSSLINNISYEENNKISDENNIANFVSEIDTQIINQVSENKFFIKNNVGYVLKKTTYEKINAQLSSLKCKVILIPDYFVNNKKTEDRITEFNNNYLFSFSDGTGTSVDSNSLEDYLLLVKKSLPNFNPSINIQNKDAQDTLKNFKNKSKFSLGAFAEQDFNALPNFYKFNVSVKNLIKRFNFSRTEIYLYTALIVFMLSMPYILIAQNNKYANTYEEETFKVFKKIDKNTKRVVTPKAQIDQLINQIPESYRTKNNSYNNLEDFEFLVSLGDKYINAVDINIANQIATITIKDMPEIQYQLISGIADRFNVLILEDEISVSSSLASGLIKIKFE